MDAKFQFLFLLFDGDEDRIIDRVETGEVSFLVFLCFPFFSSSPSLAGCSDWQVLDSR